MPIDWAVFFASKLGRWLASIAFTVLLLGGTYWLGGHNREKSIEAKYTAQIAKSNKELDKELDTRAVELEREFALRDVMRDQTKKNFSQALTDYARTQHGNKSEGTNCSNGISDDGLRLLNASIEASAGEGGRKDTGKVRAP